MRNKVFDFLLLAALVFGLGMSVASCKDDDDDKSEQRNDDADPLDTKEAQTAWQWLCALTDAQTLSDNWASKTYEPTIGEPSENNRLNRLVIVNNIGEARQHFGSLADLDPDKLTTEQTVNVPGVGKLVWTPSKQGAQNLAEVTVDTKLIPNLQKIVYCTQEQKGENGLFSTNVDGTAYYRLGDVVRDRDGYYWVCARPSFKQGDKGKSYWFNIYNASESGKVSGQKKPILNENICDKYNKKYNNKTIILPTKLKYEREHIYNLSNLIWALLDPGAYATKVGTDPTLKENGLCGFDYKYHGKNFLNAVSTYWQNDISAGYNIWQLLFHTNYDELHTLLVDYKQSLNLLYNGYSWTFGEWGNVWRYQSKGYETKMTGSKSGDEYDNNFKQDGFDIRCCAGDPDADQEMALSNTWVIRMKTGQELMVNGTYSPYEKINGCDDIYRYNQKTGDEVHNPPVEDTKVDQGAQNVVSNAMEGCGLYMVGDVVEDEEGSKWFCIVGSPKSVIYPDINDTRAMFVSFDNIKIEGGVATNIIKENELNDVVMRLGEFVSNLTGYTSDDKLTPDKLGTFGEHILAYTSFNLHKLFLARDSTWHFQDYKTKKWYDSRSTSQFFSLAYNDGSNRQAVARIICDVTQAGVDRTNCYAKDGHRIEDWQYRLYKHYEVYDTTRMAGPNENEASVCMTLWQSPWAMSTDKMYLDDVASQQMVNKYAAADKWVNLTTTATGGFQIPGVPRTKAETSARPEDYIWKNGSFATTKTSIFNEPVLFMRMMYVNDVMATKDNKTPNLVSTDGRRLKIVHMQNNFIYYSGFYQSLWATQVSRLFTDPERGCFWVDNQRVNPCVGWPVAL